MPRTKQDPLIASLIAKLPKAGEEWPVDQQLGWLRLMAGVLGLVYGGDAAAQMSAKVPVKSFTMVGPPPVIPQQPAHRFIIDDKGYAKNAQGKRVLPKDCGTIPIFDMRGEMGDMRDIIWADDSKGLNGADLVITA